MRKRSAIRIQPACRLAALLLLLAAAARSQERIVAIGDVHGAYPEFLSILRQTQLIDASQKWIGGRSILVQTGDLLDRGRGTRACLDLVMSLEREAPRAGGTVIPLLGNHEVLNLLGDPSYVTADIYRTFAGPRSGQIREKAYRDYIKFLNARSAPRRPPAAAAQDESARQTWEDAHPLGFFEYRDAMSPKGKYGAWVRTHHAIVRIGEGLFLHGGLSPGLQFRDIAELDDRVRAEIAAFDFSWQALVKKKVIWRYMTLKEALQQVDKGLNLQPGENGLDPETVRHMRQLLGMNNWLINSREGPLWYRGLAVDPEEKLTEALKGMLARLNARFTVGGHTVASKSEITARFDNHVFLIDVGMLKESYGGRAAALEIRDGQFTAHYADGETKRLQRPQWKDGLSPAARLRRDALTGHEVREMPIQIGSDDRRAGQKARTGYTAKRMGTERLQHSRIRFLIPSSIKHTSRLGKTAVPGREIFPFEADDSASLPE